MFARMIIYSLFFLSINYCFGLSEKDLSNLRLPGLMGVTIAEFQNSGSQRLTKSNWAAWESLDRRDFPTIKENQKSGLACDFWGHYEEDVDLIKTIGLNACRFSVDWSLIEPEQGIFDQCSIDHYHSVIDAMIKKGITPMITLHHFTHPQWFEELGAFEKLENIKIFINFCKKVFVEFSQKVTFWCILNEPASYVFQGYINAEFPPGASNDFHKAGTVLRNMLLAHELVYKSIKQLPRGNESQIGFVHQYLPFESYSGWRPLEVFPALFLNYIFNDVVIKFLKTGEFLFALPCSIIPAMANVFIDDEVKKIFPEFNIQSKPSFDFFGLNFYSRVVVKQQHWNPFTKDVVVPSCMDGEVMTDMPYAMYSEGLYKAIVDVSEFGVPIYITENGIADEKDDRREQFLKDYLFALSRAIDEGYDVRGWFYWTLMDNFEWNNGFFPHFGLYAVDFKTQKRTLRPSVKFLKNICCNLFNGEVYA